jgi:hypothetical protein
MNCGADLRPALEFGHFAAAARGRIRRYRRIFGYNYPVFNIVFFKTAGPRRFCGFQPAEADLRSAADVFVGLAGSQ